ncbi:MAG: prepilin peptidase [Candidatus Margulisbacteria bacterium]|nr:prepilin peptidase [Candidatus Margulisiibacteriota bacterium]
MIKFVFFVGVLLVISVIDLRSYRIPDVLTLPLIVIGLLFGFLEHRFLDSVFGMSVGYGVYFGISWLAKLYYKEDAMGAGDFKLAAAIGSMWGVTVVALTIYMSFLLGGVLGFFLLIMKFKKRREVIPFGPVIVGSSFLVLKFKVPLLAFLFLK